MTITIERCVYLALVALAAVAMWMVVLAGAPTLARAQTPGETEDRPEKSIADSSSAVRSAVVVVKRGDSLWSISERHLGARANPSDVVSLVERTYALNRETIGADPDLLLVGQSLQLPPAIRGTSAIAQPAAIKAAAEAKSTPKAAMQNGPAASPTEAQKMAPDTNSKAQSEVAEASAAGVLNAVDLPEVARPLPVPAARPVASSAAAPIWAIGSFLGEALSQDESLQRHMLGYSIILLTLLSAALMVWKLPMKRPVPSKSREAYPSFRYRYVHSNEYYAVFSPPNAEGAPADESGAEKVTTFGYSARPSGALVLARKRRMGLRRRGPNRNVHRHKRKGLTTNAYNPRIRRQLRNASPSATRKPPGVTTRPFNGTTRRSAATHSAVAGSRREASSR